MNLKKSISYLFVIIGAIVAIYAEAGESQNVYILIGGIVLLMFGLYLLSTGIQPRKDENHEDPES